jgi:hypothetical protein
MQCALSVISVIQHSETQEDKIPASNQQHLIIAYFLPTDKRGRYFKMSMNIPRNILVVVVIVLLADLSSSILLQRKYQFGIEPDMRVVLNNAQTKKVDDDSFCAIMCVSDKNCLGVNFNFMTKMCEKQSTTNCATPNCAMQASPGIGYISKWILFSSVQNKINNDTKLYHSLLLKLPPHAPYAFNAKIKRDVGSMIDIK